MSLSDCTEMNILFQLEIDCMFFDSDVIIFWKFPVVIQDIEALFFFFFPLHDLNYVSLTG